MNRDLLSQVERMFQDLNRRGAEHSLPEPGTLSNLLTKHVVASSATITVAAHQKELTCFATAAVEMWLRAVHSFLISASLTKASPIWASVSGYYSSHYSIRAFAHIFGAFNLHKQRRIVRIEKDGGRLVFRIVRKDARGSEHKFYWKCVAEHPELASDPFFYPNHEDTPNCDGSHRNKANYSDHIDRFPVFLPLDATTLMDRVEQIAGISLSSVPVPNADRFPDTESVQIIAYHRIVKFRRFIDEAIGNKNRFWTTQRNPSWRPGNMNFSVVDPVFLALYGKE